MCRQQIEKESSPGVLTSTPVSGDARHARYLSVALSASHRSEALRLGQRAINLLKCHFQREMDGRGGRGGVERDGEAAAKI